MKPATELINKAIAEAKAGNIAGARTNLAQVVRKEPENIQAWYLLSRVVEDKEQIIYCLKRVLQIMPDSPQAKARLKKLQAGPTTHASIPTQTQRKIRPGLIVLIGSAGLIESGLLLIAVFLGVNALRSLLLPIPTTLSQARSKRPWDQTGFGVSLHTGIKTYRTNSPFANLHSDLPLNAPALSDPHQHYPTTSTRRGCLHSPGSTDRGRGCYESSTATLSKYP